MDKKTLLYDGLASLVMSLIITSSHYLTHKEVVEAVADLNTKEVLEAAGATEAGMSVFLTSFVVIFAYNAYGWKLLKG